MKRLMAMVCMVLMMGCGGETPKSDLSALESRLAALEVQVEDQGALVDSIDRGEDRSRMVATAIPMLPKPEYSMPVASATVVKEVATVDCAEESVYEAQVGTNPGVSPVGCIVWEGPTARIPDMIRGVYVSEGPTWDGVGVDITQSIDLLNHSVRNDSDIGTTKIVWLGPDGSWSDADVDEVSVTTVRFIAP